MRDKLSDGLMHALGLHGFDYDEIDAQTFLGTNMCCQFGFDKELLSKGVRADISLEEDKVDAPKGVEYFLWLPTKDQHSPTQDKLSLGVAALEFFQKHHVKTYLHCKNGHGRATALLAAYLVKKGMTSAEALASIKAKRPSVHLSPAQMNGLKVFEHGLKRK